MNLRILQNYTEKSTAKALSLFCVSWAMYCAFIILSFSESWLIAVLGGFLAGFPRGQLFIIGHDAAHNAYVQSKRWNGVIGRLAFFLPLHGFSMWVALHNRYHHGSLCLKNEDDVWCPLSYEEYQNASPLRRWLERVYRSAWGKGLYYLIEMWSKWVVIPLSDRIRPQWIRNCGSGASSAYRGCCRFLSGMC